jgi:DNA mismatch repair ATPase MutS
MTMEDCDRFDEDFPFKDDYTILYLPQLGFLVRLPNDKVLQSDLSSIHTYSPPYEIPGFSFQFKTKTHAYFKNETTQLLDEEYGDIESSIKDLEASIIRELMNLLSESKEEIRQFERLIFQLDW